MAESGLRKDEYDFRLVKDYRVIDEIKGTIYDLLDNGGDVSEITERRSVSYARWNLQAASLLLQAVYGGANYR